MNRIFNMYALEKGAINVVEIETLIFVKYNVDKHIKNSAIASMSHLQNQSY